MNKALLLFICVFGIVLTMAQVVYGQDEEPAPPDAETTLSPAEEAADDAARLAKEAEEAKKRADELAKKGGASSGMSYQMDSMCKIYGIIFLQAMSFSLLLLFRKDL
ncbi:hypothetical protein AVEN_238706-1 [Araneus ventricosus]|uniref:Uncharacterized protein n=1 Tax=Araneus ventricosus TaxID=182803 RepID=A0A4Y2BYF2_ARAVE|nr:hypothetical protein AVEN_238706-1 [Araneus ventricosus]